MKKYLILTCLICLFSISNIEANKVFTTQLNSQNTSQKNEKPVTITFRGRIVSPIIGPIDGNYSVTMSIHENRKDTHIWSEPHTNITFKNGFINVILGKIDQVNNPLYPSHLNIENAHLGIKLLNQQIFIPIVSMPYTIRAISAEEGIGGDAEKVSGNFTNIFDVGASFIVNDDAIYIDKSRNTIGISTKNALYDLDINGVINASDYYINDKSYLRSLAWIRSKIVTKNIANIRDKYIGINTTKPLFNIDVFGTLNADEYYIKERQ